MPQMYDIKYSMGQLRDLDTPPHVSDSTMWHVHYYTHAAHRYTWDISDGKVYECRRESFLLDKRRNYWRWMCDEVVNDPLPIALEVVS